MPTPRSGLTAGALEGRLHVTGGEALSFRDVFGAHEVSDPTFDRWTAVPIFRRRAMAWPRPASAIAGT